MADPEDANPTTISHPTSVISRPGISTFASSAGLHVAAGVQDQSTGALVFDADAELRELTSAIRAREALRLRSSGIVLAVGMVLFVAGLVSRAGVSFASRGGAPSLPTSIVHWSVALILNGSAVMLLALGPTDTMACTVVAIILCAVQMILTLILVFGLLSSDVFEAVEAKAMVVVAAFMMALGTNLMLFGLRPGFQTRIRLKRIWTVYRLTLGTTELILIALTPIRVRWASARDNTDEFIVSLVVAHLGAVSALILTLPPVRGRIQRLLAGIRNGAHSTSTKQQSAAVVASLLGGRGAVEALSTAKTRFRAIDISDLGASDFGPRVVQHVSASRASGSTLISNSARNNVYQKSRHVPFGDVDGFVSHSVRDDDPAVLSKLQSWGESIVAPANNDAPTVWLDTVCLDNNELSIDLLCLPIFVSGCRHFLIINGPTWASRLWCVVEFFTFVQVTNNGLDNVVILSPSIDMQSQSIRIVSSKAQCAFARDRHALLAAIESCFGDLLAFDKACCYLLDRVQ